MGQGNETVGGPRRAGVHPGRYAVQPNTVAAAALQSVAGVGVIQSQRLLAVARRQAGAWYLLGHKVNAQRRALVTGHLLDHSVFSDGSVVLADQRQALRAVLEDIQARTGRVRRHSVFDVGGRGHQGRWHQARRRHHGLSLNTNPRLVGELVQPLAARSGHLAGRRTKTRPGLGLSGQKIGIQQLRQRKTRCVCGQALGLLQSLVTSSRGEQAVHSQKPRFITEASTDNRLAPAYVDAPKA